jgi:hypothetical protein
MLARSINGAEAGNMSSCLLDILVKTVPMLLKNDASGSNGATGRKSIKQANNPPPAFVLLNPNSSSHGSADLDRSRLWFSRRNVIKNEATLGQRTFSASHDNKQ